LDDAGLSPSDVDGLSYYANAGGKDAAVLSQVLGIPVVRFSAAMTGGGGGSAGSVGLAALATYTGMANVVVTVSTSKFSPTAGAGAFFAGNPDPWWDFPLAAGLVSPGQMFAVMARRHMHEYGTKREHFAEIALSSRANAIRLPTSVMKDPLTLDDYFSARMISDPLCLFDYCQMSDGAAATVTTTTERAKDLRQQPVLIRGAAQGGEGAWGQGEEWLEMPDDLFPTAGYRSIAADLYAAADVRPGDIDVAELYDHFTAMVLMELEDFGFCGRGESGGFVEDGGIRWPDGGLPVNTHGGSHSHCNLNGMNHITEAVRQIRGTAVNQVAGAELALVTGGPGQLPMSALILGKSR
jgi:acetyl-CoA acetyltransferase